MSRDLAIAIVGLGFGADFVPIYQAHPEVGCVGVVEPSADLRDAVGGRFGVEHRLASFEEVLEDDRWDAVHVLAPVRFHADYAVAALDAGKHVACAVPMATDLAAIDAVLDAEARSGRRYMMMETSAYTREHLTAKALLRDGRFGTLALYKGFHIQNLDGFPDYWQGYPPMHYLTHALSPALSLTGSRVTTVRAMGSGRLEPHQRTGGFDNPFPTEVGIFALEDSDLVCEITMSFFGVARRYVEGYDLYGTRMSLEWPEAEGDPWRSFELQDLQPGQRGRQAVEGRVNTDDHQHLLPQPLQRFTRDFVVEPADGAASFTRPAEHGGSHPHLVHEFVSAIVEDRPPAIDGTVSARWNAPGVVAHASALAGGTIKEVPRYDR